MIDILEQQRQLYQDIKDVFATQPGRRVLAWWRRQARHGHAVLIPGDAYATHFYLGRQADLNAVVEILRTDMDELLATLQARIAHEKQRHRTPADPLWGSPVDDDWLYPRQKGHDHDQCQQTPG